MKRSLFLILLAVLVMIMGSFAYVSAQDVDNMSNEQLTTLLLQIMQRLDGSGEAAEMPEPLEKRKALASNLSFRKRTSSDFHARAAVP